MSDPFLVRAPALISFSGGRSSAYMLHRILQAHGGTLPPDVHVTFQNTGKEMLGTLDFVRDCGERWGVPIVWLEYAPAGWRIVDHSTASRYGEPFAALIRNKQALPGPHMRLCTIGLKLAPMAGYAASLGWDDWTNILGLRADEPRRVARMRDSCRMPMATTGITKADVMAFWAASDFDLDILPGQGNCDLCFLKSSATIQGVMRDVPGSADWWVRAEATPLKSKPLGARFRSDRPSYAAMAKAVQDQRTFDFGNADEIVDCFCGDAA
jgi:hypothetical protein